MVKAAVLDIQGFIMRETIASWFKRRAIIKLTYQW